MKERPRSEGGLCCARELVSSCSPYCCRPRIGSWGSHLAPIALVCIPRTSWPWVVQTPLCRVKHFGMRTRVKYLCRCSVRSRRFFRSAGRCVRQDDSQANKKQRGKSHSDVLPNSTSKQAVSDYIAGCFCWLDKPWGIMTFPDWQQRTFAIDGFTRPVVRLISASTRRRRNGARTHASRESAHLLYRLSQRSVVPEHRHPAERIAGSRDMADRRERHMRGHQQLAGLRELAAAT